MITGSWKWKYKNKSSYYTEFNLGTLPLFTSLRKVRFFSAFLPLPSTAQHGLEQNNETHYNTQWLHSGFQFIAQQPAGAHCVWNQLQNHELPRRFLGVFSLSHGSKEETCYRWGVLCIEQTQSQLCSNLVANHEPGSGSLGGWGEADAIPVVARQLIPKCLSTLVLFMSLLSWLLLHAEGKMAGLTRQGLFKLALLLQRQQCHREQRYQAMASSSVWWLQHLMRLTATDKENNLQN